MRHTRSLWGPKSPPSKAPSAIWQGLCPGDWTWPGCTLGKGLEGRVSQRASATTQARPKAWGSQSGTEDGRDKNEPIRSAESKAGLSRRAETTGTPGLG